MESAIAGVVVVVAALLVWRLAVRKRAALLAEHWQGEVVEKVAAASDAQGAYKFVKVRFESGQTSFVRVRTALWEELQPHDQLTKHAGSEEPVRE